MVWFTADIRTGPTYHPAITSWSCFESHLDCGRKRDQYYKREKFHFRSQVDQRGKHEQGIRFHVHGDQFELFGGSNVSNTWSPVPGILTNWHMFVVGFSMLAKVGVTLYINHDWTVTDCLVL